MIQTDDIILYLNIIVIILFIFFLSINIIEPVQLICITSLLLLVIDICIDLDYLPILLNTIISPVIILLAILGIYSFYFKRSNIINKIIYYYSLLSNSHILHFVILSSVMVLSSFLNNSVIVSLYIPIIIKLINEGNKISDYGLLTLSYSSILGGTITILGSSTNLIAQQLSKPEYNIKLFSMVIYSLPSVIVGLLYLNIVNFILPIKHNNCKKFSLINLRVLSNSLLIDQKINKFKISNIGGGQLIGIYRDNLLKICPTHSYNKIKENDVLALIGYMDNSDLFKNICYQYNLLQLNDNTLMNSVIKPNIISAYVGITSRKNYTIANIQLKTRYQLLLLFIIRNDVIINYRLSNTTIKYNDRLVFLGLNGKIEMLKSVNLLCNNYCVISSSNNNIKNSYYTDLLTILFLFASILSSIISGKPLVLTFLVSISFLLLIGVIQWNILNESLIDFSKMLLITSSSLLITKSIELSGLLEIIISNIDFLKKLETFTLLFVLHISISFLSSILSNASVISIIIPVIKDLFKDSDKLYILILCAIHASNCCFATPMGYHTNMMVYDIGKYNIYDYAKIGIPLNILVSITFSISLYYLN